MEKIINYAFISGFKLPRHQEGGAWQWKQIIPTKAFQNSNMIYCQSGG
jgi:hypothetical protein